MTEIAPPGKLMDVGDYQMHYVYRGDAAPTIVFEAGWGADHLEWSLVFEEIASFASVFAYDRAGMGWSELSPRPRTNENIVTDLHTLLENAQIPKPYIFVAHSQGGVYARHFVDRYPDEVVGIVLVDSAHENDFARIPKDLDTILRGFLRDYSTEFKKRMALTHDEIVKLVKADLPDDAETKNPFPAEIQQLQWDRLRPRYYQAWSEEFDLRLRLTAAQEPLYPVPNLGDIPLVVLYTEANVDIDLSPEHLSALKSHWERSQKEFAALSSQSRIQFIPNSSHDIQADHPQLVIDAVREVVEMVKSKL